MNYRAGPCTGRPRPVSANPLDTWQATCQNRYMTTKAFRELAPEDEGREVRLTRPDGRVLEGQLFQARNPSYPRLRVTHWYLSRPCPIPQFEREAVSLQWEPTTTTVESLDA